MKKLLLLVAAALLVTVVSCDTLNMGGLPFPSKGPVVTVAVPANMNGGLDATWTVTWASGVGPFTISMDMGGGTTANVAAGTLATTPFTQVFTMVNPSTTTPATYTYNVRVTDSNNQVGVATATYTVGITLNADPTIDSAVYTEATKTLAVTVSDVDDGETLTVACTGAGGVTPDAASKVASATGPFVASFVFSADDFFNGATGTADITVTDSNGGSASQTGIVITIPGVVLADDTLYCFPLQTNVNTGDPVTVVIATGTPANPFQFLNGIGLTIENDADKVSNSFNVGAVGGAADAVDGYWTAMAPATFLMPPDGFIVATPDQPAAGQERWDFNLTPVGGSDQTTAKGALFNFQFTFSAAGTKTFGFQQFQAVNRTYYSDSTSTEFFWGDISNAGVSSVTVN